jgi:hypothetical protein
MSGYYYLGAQLPLLFFDREVSLTVDNFQAEARKWLTGTDLAALDHADLDRTVAAPGTPALIRAYVEFENELRTDIAAYRKSVRSGQDYKPRNLPASVIKEGDPLEVERKLLKLRWDRLGELETGHFFDIEFILIYYLKLQILRRLFTFNQETGVTAFQKLCEVEV